VMLLDGQETARLIGSGENIDQLKPVLLQMFDQTYAKMQQTALNSPAASSAASNTVPASVPESAQGGGSDTGALVAATVRLRTRNGNQTDCGTGTLIHSNTKNGNNEGLILTCGHLFRDSQGKGPVEVDLFDASGKRQSTVTGECVWYDADLDIGFVGIPLPGPIQAAPLAAPGYLPQAGMTTVSVGCTGGEDPTVWTHQIVSTDRKFHQSVRADTGDEPFYYIEVANAPKQGRSGGGLFVQDGSGRYALLGICNAGDTTTNEGYFLPSSVIYHQLSANRNLAFVYEEILQASSSNPGTGNPAANHSVFDAALQPAVSVPAASREPVTTAAVMTAPTSSAGADPALGPAMSAPGSVSSAMTPALAMNHSAGPLSSGSLPSDSLSSGPVSSDPLSSGSVNTALASMPDKGLAYSSGTKLAAEAMNLPTDMTASPVGFETAEAGNFIPSAAETVPAEQDIFAASIEELRRMHEQGAEIICIVNWPNQDGKKESDVVRLNPKP